MIRNLDTSHAAQLIPLLIDLGYPNQDVVSLANRIQIFVSQSRSFIYGFYEQETLVAFGSLSLIPLIHEDGYLGRVSALAVKENAQGKGIGRQLMLYMERVAVSHNCTRMELTSGAHRESQAHIFYTKIGYQKYSGARFVKSLLN
jgi:GNAT superfamily N-acetyltransferase